MTATTVRPIPRTHIISGRFLVVCGVLLPLAAILFEAATAICAGFIDPMPSWEYVVLVLSVPACNAAAWLGLRRDAVQHSRLFAAMAGFSGAIAVYYTILFLPIMPMAAVGLIVLLPVLAFAPVLALWAAIKLMRAWAGFAGVRMVVLGLAGGMAALVALALPALELRAGARMVQSEHRWLRNTGFRMLRFGGVRQALQEAIETTAGARQPITLLSGRGPLTQQDARRLYYRVWGESFDRKPLPQQRARGSWLTGFRPAFDPQQGGDRVGAPVHGVRLSASRIDGSLDAGSATGYFEWTFVFHNDTAVQQEARMEIALPPGGVVSRGTLWIHGVEREAAFGERAQVRQAYENVVRMRRDPLLITSSSRDRVLVQCFPVEPSGDMKIRIGITAPVLPEGLGGRGIATLPALVDRNFDAGDPAPVWIESRSELAATWSGAEAKVSEDGVNVLRGDFREGQRAAVRVSGLAWESSWAPENAAGDRVIQQDFLERTVAPPERAIVIVDGSESTRGMRKEIGAALATIPAGIETRVIVAGRDGLADWGSAGAFEGGVDAVPALEAALRAANEQRRTVLVWIAGEQPIRIAPIEAIRQTFERGRGRYRLSVLAGGGDNVVWRELNGLPGVEAVPRYGSAGEDLSRLFARWRAPETVRVAERKALPLSGLGVDARRGSPHMVRLWAAEEAERIAERNHGAAVSLAVAHQIVTPFSGAVVLETAAQYQQNALQPASSTTVPTMPEPETWGLLAVGLLVVVFFAWQKRRRLRLS